MTHTQTKYSTVESIFSHSRTAWVLHHKSLSYGTRCTSELEALRWFSMMKARNMTAAISRNGKVRYSFIADPALPRLDYEREVGPLPRLQHYGVQMLAA